jgi:hypothetical protein
VPNPRPCNPQPVTIPTVLSRLLVSPSRRLVSKMVASYNLYCAVSSSVVQWSEFLATDPEARVQLPALPKKEIVGL